ncbi:CYTH and CHAD domain-containing protein [Rugosimonospora africana]|uniref:CHAD domain-containing protein n=1 Tax=Rugosimonospora africana TaxID=556532 RepID=A0A8J3QPX1_9ACTN|nr:CYTH and CHAD domain-containing protein [Rugosimonospora africana]GIH13565.1 CHAD domain-containing protein [Rugosimonospora africana]
MLEEERKFDVDPQFVLPDLTEALPARAQVVPRPSVSLRATYYDTDDLRLARAGASLRFRRGDEKPWTVKLPTGVPGIRHEISRTGPSDTIPEELAGLVTAYVRGAALSAAAVLDTTRQVYELRDRAGELLAELDDDLVAVMEGGSVRRKFREIEVERHEGGSKLLGRVADVLTAAGAVSGQFLPKHVRALNATGPADLTPPAGTLPPGADAGQVVTEAIRADIGRMLAHDPLVRLGTPLPDGDTAVHQMRVGCRRLRTDLRTFRPLLDPDWADRLRAELSWIAEALGGARDVEVLRARLRRTAARDPLSPLDPDAVARFDAELEARHSAALAALAEAMSGKRYLALLDRLVDAAAAPRLAGVAADTARDLLPRLAGKPWRRLADGSAGTVAAGSLDPLGPDEEWHDVRIRAKRARYATEAVAAVLGGNATSLARRIGEVQELLGEHQDAVIAADTWLAIAEAHPDDHRLAVAAGRLVERERGVVREVRARFPETWAAASRLEPREWLR